MLGLIFEKLNGYKDGSFYTPGFITMHMARETIRPAVVRRFNERFGLELSGFPALKNWCLKNLNEPQAIADAEAVIDALRICDPAVGSGHFLVSALNELLAIKSELHLLTDTDGTPLHDQSVEVANDELIVTNNRTGEHFRYAVPSDGRPIPPEMQRVQSALFEQKRRLIENGLFGVDINPNSVKICRLRLWIELLKNAYYLLPDGADLRTLPNIDINIKQGNSLFSRFGLGDNIEAIMRKTTYTADQYRGFVQDYKQATDRDMRDGIERILHGIEAQFSAFSQARDPRIVKRNTLAKELDSLTGDLFGGGGGYTTEAARSKARKRIAQIEKEIEAVSTEIARESGGRAHGGAFEWRYAFPEVLDRNSDYLGFDIVIGNPPYVDVKEMSADDAKMLFSRYASAKNRINLYAAFIDRGMQLVSRNGALAFIVPNSLLMNESYSKLRGLLLDHVDTLVKLPDGVFEEAAVETMLLFAQKTPLSSPVRGKVFKNNEEPDLSSMAFTEFSRDAWRKDREHRFNITSSGEASAVCAKMESGSEPLGSLCDFSLGITPYDKQKGQDRELIESRGFHARHRLSDEYVPLIDGGSILRYSVVDTPKEWLRYGPWLGAPRERRFFTEPRMIGRQIVSGKPPRVYVGYTEKELYHTQIGFAILPKSNITPKLKFLLGLINSKLMNFYHEERFLDKEKVTFQKFLIANCKKLPVRVPDSSTEASIVERIDQILTLKNEGLTCDTSALEAEVDHLVYGLYGLTEEEVMVVEGRLD